MFGFGVVVVDGVGINGCVPSASAPEVYVLQAGGGNVAPTVAAGTSPGDGVGFN